MYHCVSPWHWGKARSIKMMLPRTGTGLQALLSFVGTHTDPTLVVLLAEPYLWHDREEASPSL